MDLAMLDEMMRCASGSLKNDYLQSVYPLLIVHTSEMGLSQLETAE
ncbi:hypothetical protein DFP78_10496 [Photobacterium lutimaris]|nr:hypothetical protein DFP78_10496 [Photobacterium lutimaris]